MNHLFGWSDALAFQAGGEKVRWSDLLGNLLGLATVALALRRSLWTWPVQITGAILLLGANLAVHLGGTAARQLAVIALAGYGWSRWRRGAGGEQGGVRVRWASWSERAALLGFLAAGTAAFAWLLTATHSSWNPLPDAYIFIGTLAAMIAQGRGWVEFWFVWIAVDVVGVPLAFSSGLPVSGFTYVVYFALVLTGLRQWTALARTPRIAVPQHSAAEHTATQHPAPQSGAAPTAEIAAEGVAA